MYKGDSIMAEITTSRFVFDGKENVRFTGKNDEEAFKDFKTAFASLDAAARENAALNITIEDFAIDGYETLCELGEMVASLFWGFEESVRSVEILKSDHYRSIGGSIFTKDGKVSVYVPALASEITLSKEVDSFEWSAFPFPSRLENIFVESGNSVFASVDGVLYDREKTVLLRCPPQKTEIQIPESVREFFTSSFAGSKCKSLSPQRRGENRRERLYRHE